MLEVMLQTLDLALGNLYNCTLNFWVQVKFLKLKLDSDMHYNYTGCESAWEVGSDVLYFRLSSKNSLLVSSVCPTEPQ